MTAYSPFTLTESITVVGVPKDIWHAVTSPTQMSWNPAILDVTQSMGALTGSNWQTRIQTLAGQHSIKWEVVDSLPHQHLALNHTFRFWLVSHQLQLAVSIHEIDPMRTNVSMSLTLNGYFSTRLWPIYAKAWPLTLGLWLNALKQQIENDK